MGQRSIAKTLKPEMSAVELEGLESWIRDAVPTGRHLEIGTAAGGTLVFLMQQYAPDARPPFTVVDTMAYFDNQLEIVKGNLRDNQLNPDRVNFQIMRSSAAFAAAEERGDRFDFILVDASHKIRYVMDDMRWLRLLNVGGIACFHDYKEKFPGVQLPVDRFLRRNSHFKIVGQAGSLLCMRRDGSSSRREVTCWDRLWATVCSTHLQWRRSILKRFAKK
jgi:hypothetical protein